MMDSMLDDRRAWGAALYQTAFYPVGILAELLVILTSLMYNHFEIIESFAQGGVFICTWRMLC